MTHSTLRFAHISHAALLILAMMPATARGQDRPYPSQLLTLDPRGFATGRITAETEFCDDHASVDGWSFGCNVTAGLSVSGTAHNRAADSRASRHHADVDGVLRVRFTRFTGGWFGLRTGLTYADRHGLRPSLGVESGLSFLITRRYYLGASIGAKKVFLLDAASDLRYNPAIRFAAGFAF